MEWKVKCAIIASFASVGSRKAVLRLILKKSVKDSQSALRFILKKSVKYSQSARTSRNVKKKHPKNCKRFASENDCRFQEKCAYRLQVNRQIKDHNELKKKVAILEKTVLELINKVVNMGFKKLEHLKKIVMLEKVVGALSSQVPKIESE